MAAGKSVQSATGGALLETVEDYRTWRSAQTGPVGLVPTMGALHSGHMALVRRARQECASVAVSIFVNPTQFGPKEDFSKYPRTLERDLELCRQEGVDVVFHPKLEQMYPKGSSNLTSIHPPPELTNTLEGTFRPGHFLGVATVVCKLLNIAQPAVAYFGEKDYQQLLVIRRMVRDLDLPIRIAAVSTVREADGLALSSRNVYLSPEQRALAPILHKTLCQVRDAIISGAKVGAALSQGRAAIESTPQLSLQYLEACHADTLEKLEQGAIPLVILVAAKLGDVRLIDNVIVS